MRSPGTMSNELLDVGLSLLDFAEREDARQESEYADQYAASQVVAEAEAALRAVYIRQS